MTAREKCKKAESTSELNSELSAGEERKKRRIKKKRKLSSSSEDDSITDNYRFLQTPPLLEGNLIIKKLQYSFYAYRRVHVRVIYKLHIHVLLCKSIFY